MLPSQDLADPPLTETPGEAARRTLARRIAHRNRLRAERLARLRSEIHDPRGAADGVAEPDAAPEVQTALPPAAVEAGDPAADAAAEDWLAAMADGPAEAEPEAADPADASGALEEFLQALTALGEPVAAPDDPEDAAPAAVLRFERPEPALEHVEPRAAPICDLHRLAGVGPGLTWALQRAGIACRDELADLDPAELAARLGPLGALVPASSWIAAARAARDGGGS